MYPAYIADSNRLAYVRITKSRISYYRNYVEHFYTINNQKIKCSVTLLTQNTHKINVEIDYSWVPNSPAVVKAKFIFIGIEARLIGELKGEKNKCDYLYKYVFNSENKITKHFAELVFQNFMYEYLDSEDMNVCEYLNENQRYKVNVVDWNTNPVVLIKKAYN